MPPSKPQKKEPVKPKPKPTSTADVLRPVAKPVQVSAPVVAPMSYDIGQSSYIDPTVSSQWNPQLEFMPKPDMPIPTPAMLPLDMKRQAAFGAGYTDNATNQLYKMSMGVQPYDDPNFLSPSGTYVGEGAGDPNGRLEIWRSPLWDSKESINHEFSHATIPNNIDNFLVDLNELAKANSDPAQGALQDWQDRAGHYPANRQFMETYAYLGGRLKDPYAREQIPEWFLNNYYPGIYK